MPKRIRAKSFASNVVITHVTPPNMKASSGSADIVLKIKNTVNNIYDTVQKKYDDKDFIYTTKSIISADDVYFPPIINDIAKKIDTTFRENIEIITNHIIEYTGDTILASLEDKIYEHDVAYNYLESHEIITTIKDTNITKLIIDIKDKNVSNSCLTNVLTNNQLISLYNNFIKPYNEYGPYTLPQLEIFNMVYGSIVQLIDNDNENNIVLLLFRDVLSILLDMRNIYVDNIKLTTEVESSRTKYQESIQLIQSLQAQLAQYIGCGTGDFILSGNLGLKIKQPKSLVYAQAILDINRAWYIYLYKSVTIDASKYYSTIQYVKSLGTREEAYNKLITLFDEKYNHIEDDMINIDNTSNNDNISSCDSLSISDNSSNCGDPIILDD